MCTRIKIEVRLAQSEDAGAIAEVLKNAFSEYEQAYTNLGYAATTIGRDVILSRMGEGPMWVAVCGPVVVGTASAVQKETGLYIRSMAVMPTARTRGLGRLLLREAELYAKQHDCRRLFLSTTPFLSRAIHLYESCGFRPIEDGPNDLFGTPLLTMEKNLFL